MLQSNQSELLNQAAACKNMAQPEVQTVELDDPILVTGSAGFIGTRVVEALIDRGFRNVRLLIRPSSQTARLEAIIDRCGNSAHIELLKGNLLSRDDCVAATRNIKLIYHLAAGRGEKSYPDAFMNSVVTTRNLLDACLRCSDLKRFVSISSFSVYSNRGNRHGRLLDESCPVENMPELRGDAYSFAKSKQDEMIQTYGARHGVPYVIVRPGFVYGPGNEGITGRVGLGTFGLFLHLGGGNAIPFSYVDNCAEAIVLAGLVPGVTHQTFNVVDDDLPSSRLFLRLYKRHVRYFRSVYVPHGVSYLLCYLWEKYSEWSKGQLPPVFNRMVWHAYWKSTRYSNEKLKNQLGWHQKVSSKDGLTRYFESCRLKNSHA